eukprot:TRINITY_DN856_c0_g1_i1.p1 TRINITY_DN856_c0_g1~~TRINITY_DN856_c0_g1_i1.p1  ORF type:complete len:155 (-),score=58.24 TRINITY_DN856_c0_g1_i1:251-715(-)
MSDDNGKKFGPKVWVDFLISSASAADGVRKGGTSDDMPPLEMAPNKDSSVAGGADGDEGQQGTTGSAGGGDMENSGEKEMVDDDIDVAIAREASLEERIGDLSLEDMQIEGLHHDSGVAQTPDGGDGSDGGTTQRPYNDAHVSFVENWVYCMLS